MILLPGRLRVKIIVSISYLNRIALLRPHPQSSLFILHFWMDQYIDDFVHFVIPFVTEKLIKPVKQCVFAVLYALSQRFH